MRIRDYSVRQRAALSLRLAVVTFFLTFTLLNTLAALSDATIYTALWIGWLFVFAVIEYRALADPERGDTLSEHVWAWFSLRSWRAAGARAKAMRFVFLTFWSWLTFHFLTGGAFA